MSVEHVHALSKGVRLNQYEMMNILGAGGFGITYMARDTTLDTMVAIKEYLPGDFAVRQGNSQVTAKSSNTEGDFEWGLTRFLEEARVLAKFRHPHIVRVNQIFEANNTAYLVMEYAKGESLSDYLRRVGPLSEEQTKDILFPILDGLKRVHEQGFLHRDIKPDNIIIRDEEGAVLIDFGAARQAIETKSRAITSIVTEGYAPLEQYDPKGNQGAWTDIYALAGVVYKCMTGEKPPPATSRVRNDPLVPLALAAKVPVSATFSAAIDSALSVFENSRPQTAGDFVAMLSPAAPAQPAYADDTTRMVKADVSQTVKPVAAQIPAPGPNATSVSLASVSIVTPAQPAARKTGPVYLGVAAVVLLLIAAGGWFYSNGAHTPAPASAENQPAAPATAAEQTAKPAANNPSVSAAPTAQATDRAPPAPAPRPSEQSSVPANTQSASREPAAPTAAPSPAIRPSFDCMTAKTIAEHLVCADSQLATMDLKMTELYQKGLGAVSDANAFRGEQQAWLSQRDDCGDKQCLVGAYNDRIREIQRWIGP